MADSTTYILTGEIHSGKTTAITTWLTGRHDVYGILTPKIEGTRFFVDAHTKEQFAMEASKEENEVLEIGRFRFSKNGFEKASAILMACSNNEGWLVVDEIGPLELQRKAFYETIKKIIEMNNQKMKKLLVVRQTLVDEVVSFFKIKDYQLITSFNEL